MSEYKFVMINGKWIKNTGPAAVEISLINNRYSVSIDINNMTHICGNYSNLQYAKNVANKYLFENGYKY